MDIKIVSVSAPNRVSKGKASWVELKLEYENSKGESKTQTLRDFADADVFQSAQAAEVGSWYSVQIAKEGSYFKWKSFSKLDGPPTSSGGASSPGNRGNNWDEKNKLDRERFELEKDKQIKIIRQSVLSTAATILAGQKDAEDRLIPLASRLESFVLRGQDKEEDAIETGVE